MRALVRLARRRRASWNIVKQPGDARRAEPARTRWRFVTGHGFASFVVLGSVLLAITGAEALYADMGHFGTRAIRVAWFGLVAPALVLNYFGQGALLIDDPKALENPFYLAVPVVGAVPDGGARHRGDGHRLAGDDLGRATR